MIKVGMIRADLHAIYYANLIQEHDPYVLREPEYGKGGYFYFYTHYRRTRDMMFQKVSGFEIVKLWDEKRENAEKMSKIYFNKPKVCNTLEEVSDGVDLVFIADCDGDGTDHLKLATPGLKKGIVTFIDKPFAYDVKDAREIIKLADKYKTLVMSLSILREVPQFTQFKNRFSEIEEPEFAVIKGPGGRRMPGHIHTISLAQHLFGYGVESVECMGQNELGYIHLNYVGDKLGKPKVGVVICNDSGGQPHCAFYASVYSKLGSIHSPGIGDYEFPYGCIKILEKVKKMVETRKSQVSYDEMVENIAIATAARIAQKTGKTVYLKDVQKKVNCVYE